MIAPRKLMPVALIERVSGFRAMRGLSCEEVL